nr:hypothetical protein [Tessaracoccus coleopterorum]
MPSTSPSATTLPEETAARTGWYVVRHPLPWSTLTTGVPATTPANSTTPAAAARTVTPAVAARSTPRCPAS